MADLLNKFKERDTRLAAAGGKKIRVGIIGTGWISEMHIVEYQKMDDVEIIAAADLVPGKAEALMERLGVKGVRYYPNDRAMIDAEQLDAVSICTYNCQHAPCAIYALEHGVNVMLEKPFKKIVDSGELGDIYDLQAGGGRRHGIPTPFGTTFIEKDTAGIGAVGDIGSYSLDMLLKAVGYPKPLTVTGYTSSFFGKNPATYPAHPEYADKFAVDDFAAAFVRLEGGIMLDFRISWDMHMDTCGDALILGTKGGLRIPSTECWNGSFDKPMTIYKDVAGQPVSYTVPLIDDADSLFYKKLRSFVNAIQTGGAAPVPSSEILYNQAIIDAIVKSADCGREIEVAIPEI